MSEGKEAGYELEAASFAGHIFQLTTAAMVYLGAAKLPGSEKVEVNLPLAKLTIDTIAMLKAKTEGNRTADETAFLEDVLYRLRLDYVKAESPAPSNPAERAQDEADA